MSRGERTRFVDTSLSGRKRAVDVRDERVAVEVGRLAQRWWQDVATRTASGCRTEGRKFAHMWLPLSFMCERLREKRCTQARSEPEEWHKDAPIQI